MGEDDRSGLSPENEKQQCYSVKCVFRLCSETGHNYYEERVTLWRASSFDEALELAKQEAEFNALVLGGESSGPISAFWIYEDDESPLSFPQGQEIDSMLRLSDLELKDYIARFVDTGKEIRDTNPGP